MQITNTEVYGFRAAIRGARNAKYSHARSDSLFWEQAKAKLQENRDFPDWAVKHWVPELPLLGPNDLKLLTTLAKQGRNYRPSHSKALRLIQISADFVLPRYTWQDWDTYKVGTVRLSGSSVCYLEHCILTPQDFEDEDIPLEHLNLLISLQEDHNQKVMLRQGDPAKRIRRIKKLLPEGFLQLSTIQLNYQVAAAIYQDRKDHILEEFRLESEKPSICKWLKSLPYSFLITGES